MYPCAQLLQGAARLLPSPRYFPLHLRCRRALARLERAAGAYVPLAAPLLDMLDWSGLSKALSSAAPGRPSESSQLLRVSKATLGSAAFQHDLVDQACTQDTIGIKRQTECTADLKMYGQLWLTVLYNGGLLSQWWGPNKQPAREKRLFLSF